MTFVELLDKHSTGIYEISIGALCCVAFCYFWYRILR